MNSKTFKKIETKRYGNFFLYIFYAAGKYNLDYFFFVEKS